MRDINRTLALRLAEHNIATFPCRPDTRKPLIKWGSLSTTDAQIIAGLWVRYPGALPAIDLRKSGLIVLDGDRHHAEVDGVAALRELVKQHRIGMRHVPIAHTPRNGVHLYFGNTAELGCRKGALPPGIDVKGSGGFVLAPGTTLPDGRTYRPAGPCLLNAVRAGGAPPLPDAIAEIINTSRYTAPEAPNGGPPCSDRRAKAYASAALTGCAADLAAMAKNTGRNMALNASAFRLGRMVANGWLDHSEVVHQLRRAADACGLMTEDGPRSVDKTITSGLNAGLRNPHPGLAP
jgi:Bifunctional DNA primase/polymerase, N-terminal